MSHVQVRLGAAAGWKLTSAVGGAGLRPARFAAHHISTQQIGREMGLKSTDHYVARRQLRFAGHVSRMDFERRLPRRMLSSWVPHARSSGAPTLTYGRSLGTGRSSTTASLDPARWHDGWLAADRGAWRTMLQRGIAPAEFHPRPPSPPPARTKPSRGCAAQTTMAAIDRMRATQTRRSSNT